MRISSLLLLAAISIHLAGCGPAQISEENKRKSDRFYEAAYISWSDKNDTLTAIRHLTRSVEANPENDDAQYLLGTIRLGRGELDEALPHLQAAVKLRQGQPAKLVEAQNSLAVLYIHQKKLDDAIKLLEEASAEVLNRAPWLAFGNLGWAYTEKGQYDKAIAALRRAMFDQPQFCLGLYRMGNAYYQKGEFATARDRLVDAINTDAPGCDRLQEAHYLLGMTYLRLDQLDDAITSFDNCVEINPNTPDGISCAEIRDGL